MREISASEMKQNFGACIEAAQAEPVVVKRSGRPSVVVLSITEYDRLKAIEEAQWGSLAQKALQEGLLSDQETAAWFARMQGQLHANP